MDFEAKIEWKPGMALTASVLRHRDSDLDERYQALLKTVLGLGRVCILPGFDYCVHGAISGRTYELTDFACTALLPSGNIFHIHDDLKIDIPVLSDGVYFMAVRRTGMMHLFECDDVPYSRPEYELCLCCLDELEGSEMFPFKKFMVEGGVLSEQDEYIPPVLSIFQDERFGQFILRTIETLSSLGSHPHLDDEGVRRMLWFFLFKLKSFSARRTVFDLVELLVEIALGIDSFLVDGLGKDVEDIPHEINELKEDIRRKPCYEDITPFLKWMEEYLASQSFLLEKVTPRDDSIDLEQLKKDIEEDLFEKLRAQLSVRIYEDLYDKLVNQVSETVSNTVRLFIEDKLRPELRDMLNDELHGTLYPELYDALYAELSKLSYSPVPADENVYTPLI